MADANPIKFGADHNAVTAPTIVPDPDAPVRESKENPSDYQFTQADIRQARQEGFDAGVQSAEERIHDLEVRLDAALHPAREAGEPAPRSNEIRDGKSETATEEGETPDE